MNEFNLPKEYKWEQLHTKIDGVKFIQAASQAETTSYLAQVPPTPGILLLGFIAANTRRVYISQYDITTSAIVWTVLN